jgi:hypothetical protein
VSRALVDGSASGIQRRPGAPRLPRGNGPARRCPVPGLAEGTTRQVVAWRLDRERLKALAAAVAPGIPFVDAIADGDGDGDGTAIEGTAIEGACYRGAGSRVIAPETADKSVRAAGQGGGRVSSLGQSWLRRRVATAAIPVRLAGYGYDQLEDWVRATLSAALLPDG